MDLKTETEKPSISGGLGAKLYFVSVYSVAAGALYLWGYWSPFNINVLEYLELSDIVKVTVFPLMTGSLAIAVGAMLGSYSPLGRLEPGHGRYTKTGRFLHRFGHVLLLLYIVAITLFSFFGPARKWLIAPFLFAAPFSYFISNTAFLAKEIRHPGLRNAAILVVTVFPLIAFGTGRKTADDIQTGTAYTYLASELTGYPAGENSKHRLRLVGHAGDFMFFFDPNTSAVVMTKLQEDKPLALKTAN